MATHNITAGDKIVLVRGSRGDLVDTVDYVTPTGLLRLVNHKDSLWKPRISHTDGELIFVSARRSSGALAFYCQAKDPDKRVLS